MGDASASSNALACHGYDQSKGLKRFLIDLGHLLTPYISTHQNSIGMSVLIRLMNERGGIVVVGHLDEN